MCRHDRDGKGRVRRVSETGFADLPDVASVLRTFMRHRRMNSPLLAAAMTRFGVQTSPSLIRELTRGARLQEPRRDTLAALAAVLEVPVTVFFDLEAYRTTDLRLERDQEREYAALGLNRRGTSR